jgi:hypothetical protein
MKQKKGRGGQMVLKLDMEKAFDIMELSFYSPYPSRDEFSPYLDFLDKRMHHYSYLFYFDQWKPFGHFAPSRGLGQGDPLSPFLFILGIEILSYLFLQEELNGEFRGAKISCSVPSITHLLFVDDLIIFGHSTAQEAATIKHCLDTFLMVRTGTKSQEIFHPF